MDNEGVENPDFIAASDPVHAHSHLTPKQLKFRMLKNVLIISVAFMCLFTSYTSMSNLQTSLNPGIGPTSLTTLYVALVLSCMFLPTWMIKRFKAKWTMAVSMLGYSVYIAAQFYPEEYTLIPAAIIVGLCAAPMWSAKCTYLTQIGTKYADLVGEDREVIITRFFGIFFMFFQTSQVWGNLISSTVLSSGRNVTEDKNATYEICGVGFCPGDIDYTNPNFVTDKTKIYIMASIYLVFSISASVIVGLFVEPLTNYGEDSRIGSSSGKTGNQLLVATFQHMRHPYQLLIIPLTIWSGVEQAFIGADYTAAYVACALGIHMVGYVMITFGASDAIFSYAFTPMVKLVGRVPIFLTAAAINLGWIIYLMVWKPDPDEMALFFVGAGLWGISDAVWQTQINSFYGVIFPGETEAAFSNYRLWESIGFIIAYACSTILCVSDKIIILIVFLVLGIVGYLIIEIIERRGGVKKDSFGIVVPIDRLIRGKTVYAVNIVQ